MRDLHGATVMVTGGAGFLGRRIVAILEDRAAKPVITRSTTVDLTDPRQVRQAISDVSPQYVIHAAGDVGGIGANRQHPGRFFYANAVMGIHLLHEAWLAGVEKVVIIGTVCSYPKHTPIPFREKDLWSGYPEETNAPYGLAKKMLLVQARAYYDEYGFRTACLIPTNLYGPNDSFDLETSHVIPAIITKCVEAVENGRTEVVLWGSGTPSREFVYVEDAAEAIVLALEHLEEPDPVNLGAGEEVKISELATMIAEATGFRGKFVWDVSQPDGQPRRAVDGARAQQILGWRPRVSLRDGIASTVAWYLSERKDHARASNHRA